MYLAVNERPFAVDTHTMLMYIDGIFDSSRGTQYIGIYYTPIPHPIEKFTKDFHCIISAPKGSGIYFKQEGSVYDPSLPENCAVHRFSPEEYEKGQPLLRFIRADFTGAKVGKYKLNFSEYITVTGSAGDYCKGIDNWEREIFVVISYGDPKNNDYRVFCPEGSLDIHPTKVKIIPPNKEWDKLPPGRRKVYWVSENNPDFLSPSPLPPFILPMECVANISRWEPFSGKYGEIPFQDPWWKVVGFIAFLVFGALSYTAAALSGSDTKWKCEETKGPLGEYKGGCSIQSPGSESGPYVMASILGAISSIGLAAALSDEIDPFRSGEEHTECQSAREKTVSEVLNFKLQYFNNPNSGEPFKMKTNWEFKRISDQAKTYLYSDIWSVTNPHISSISVKTNYEKYYPDGNVRIDAIIKNQKGQELSGTDAYVVALVFGPKGQFRPLALEPVNGRKFAGILKLHDKEPAVGTWSIYIISQTVNKSKPNDPPLEAAKNIGGLITNKVIDMNIFNQCNIKMIPSTTFNVKIDPDWHAAGD